MLNKQSTLIVLSSLLLLFTLVMAACNSALGPIDAGTPITPSRYVLSAGVDPMPCGASELGLSEKWIEVLEANDFGKCVRPFGLLIGADSRVPDVYIEQAARIVAEVLDPDMDGIANDLKVAALVADYETAWIPMPADIDRWDSGGLEEELDKTLGSYGLMLPRWWMLGDRNFGDSNPDKHAKAVMVEEILHFMTQFGYSPAYPEIFGVDDWGSIIAKETKLASCDWWQHPENDCPGSPGYDGDCSGPSCDVTEFYQQVLVMRAGMEPGWAGIGFPSTADALEAKLSSALKAVLDDPQYHQINEPLRFSYPDRDPLKDLGNRVDDLEPSLTTEAQRLIELGWNRPTSAPTTYLRTSDLSDDSVQVVQEGIQAGESYLGSYGPFRVYVIGTDIEAAHIVAEDFCSWAYGRAPGSHYEYCLESDQGIEIREIAEYAGSNAFAQHSRQLETPNQSFVIGNPLRYESGFGSKIALHEYVHIYQNANRVDENDFGLPLWLEEGSAEFLALYLSQKEGWVDFRMSMTEALRSAKELKGRYPDIGIQDMETSESRDELQSICDCTGTLQYETGQWATAWLVNRTSLDTFYKSYIPGIVELGGHQSFVAHFGLTIPEFYSEFEEFMSFTSEQQLAILPAK